MNETRALLIEHLPYIDEVVQKINSSGISNNDLTFV